MYVNICTEVFYKVDVYSYALKFYDKSINNFAVVDFPIVNQNINWDFPI